MAEFNELKGKTLTKIVNNDDVELYFYCLDGDVYKMWYEQDWCNMVELNEVCGDFDDLIGYEILEAEAVSNADFENKWRYIHTKESDSYKDSHTWTFYKIVTFNGSVTLRWFGEINGYYSESVNFAKRKPDGSYCSWD